MTRAVPLRHKVSAARHARTARSRDRAPRLAARDGGRALRQGGGAPPRPALAVPEGFRQAADRQDRDRPRPPGKISARRSLFRRRADHASRNVRLVPGEPSRRRGHAGPVPSRPLGRSRARPRGVPHVLRRDRHLQRSAPVRIHAAGATRRARPTSARQGARPGAARQRIRAPRCWQRPAPARRPASRRR